MVSNTVKTAGIWIGGAAAALIIVIGLAFWFADSFIGAQVKRINDTAQTVSSTVEVVVEKGGKAGDIASKAVEKVGAKVKDIFGGDDSK